MLVFQTSLLDNMFYLFQDTVNLPKVAALFWGHADEERDHAKQFIEYLRMRWKHISHWNTQKDAISTLQGSNKQRLLWLYSHRAEGEDVHVGRGGGGLDHGPQDGEGRHRQDEGHDRHLLNCWQ